MDAVRIGEFRQHVDEEVVVRGWLHNKRSSGKLRFLTVRDGSGYTQAVVSKKAVPPEAWEAVDEAGQESSLEVTGRVRQDDRAPGGYEMDVGGVRVLDTVHEYPITPKEHGTAFLMENRHLWLRSTRQHAIARVRHTVIKATRDYLDDQGVTAKETSWTPLPGDGSDRILYRLTYPEGSLILAINEHPPTNSANVNENDSFFYICNHLKSKGISTGIHYPVALPNLKAYAYLNHKKNEFPEASPERSVVRWEKTEHPKGFGIEFAELSEEKRIYIQGLMEYFELLAKAGVKF